MKKAVAAFSSILVSSLILGTALGPARGAVPSGKSDRHHIVSAMDVSWFNANSDLPSWLEGGNGKLRYDSDHDGLRINRLFMDYRGRITPTLSGRFTVNMNDNISEKIDITEAFVEWRPLPRSEWRFRTRGGIFYPRLSLENIDPGWSNPYSLSSSVINTWIGEELRTIGAEFRAIRDVPGFPDQQISFEGAMFVGNDPTGAQLTWRGWAAHDRQTGVTGSVPMPAVSAIEPWDPGGNPTATNEPFREIDHRAGYYAGAQWRWGERAMIKGFHYDNNADPVATSGDAYAWETKFDHLQAQFALPGKVGLFGQWINGSSKMGPDLGPWRVQDVEFDSTYLTVTRAIQRHRLSVRYEWFNLQPFNDPIGITNKDEGNALALTWLFQLNQKLRFGAEYMQIQSEHCDSDTCFWVFNGLPRNTRESQAQVSMRWYFKGTGRTFR